MKRHSFRWTGLAFGALFLAIAGNWAVWDQDLLSPEQFSFTLSAVLIVAGVLGVIATFVKPRRDLTQPTQDWAHQPTTDEFTHPDAGPNVTEETARIETGPALADPDQQDTIIIEEKS